MVQFPLGASDLSLLQSDETGAGAHASSHSVGIKDNFPEGKRLGPKFDHLLPSTSGIVNEWSWFSTFPYALLPCTEKSHTAQDVKCVLRLGSLIQPNFVEVL